MSQDLSASRLELVSDYLKARTEFIDSERSLRKDYGLLKNATDDELQAEKIIRQIRALEQNEIRSEEHIGVPNMFPGMAFLSARNLIMRTKIFNTLKKMPKGAILHSHLGAMVDTAVLLSLALKHPTLHIRIPTKLSASTINTVKPEFRAFPCPTHPISNNDVSASITGVDGKVNEWVNMRVARENFSNYLGGPEGFDAWVTGAMTINPAEAYGTHNTETKIWQKFQDAVDIASGLTGFYPIWTDYIRNFFHSSIEDGICYIETRVDFYKEFMSDVNGDENIPHSEWIRAFKTIVEEVKDEMSKQGRPHAFIGAKVIYTTLRFVSCEELEWYLNDCIGMKQQFPDVIAGFDLVGNEDLLTPLSFYIEPLLRFRRRVNELGLDIPFMFHAGETLGDGTHADSNLYDAILLGTRRIGHGYAELNTINFSIVKHPKIMNLCKENGITLEVCPISNEVLRLTSSMPAHPLPIMLNNGVPVALSPDDPAVFGNMGLSFDFFQVLVASEINGLMTLKGIAHQSIESSTLSEHEKSAALDSWNRSWVSFVESIVDDTVLT